MSVEDPKDRPIRVLLAKPGLDGHDRGVKVLALALRDAGFEVLYTGLHRTCEEIVTMAIQEDVDVIGVSMLSGGHYAALSQIMALLREHKAQDIIVVAGGFLPDREEVEAIKALGVRAVFDTDTRIESVTSLLRDAVRERRRAADEAMFAGGSALR
ncbi:MAG: cobalamin B12-binding domain-containing protein [Burkholderiaceae bacterium]|nr:cobalamin B12-binding domain-containing protein [Burkholderiaceae bacterium]